MKKETLIMLVLSMPLHGCGHAPDSSPTPSPLFNQLCVKYHGKVEAVSEKGNYSCVDMPAEMEPAFTSEYSQGMSPKSLYKSYSFSGTYDISEY